MRKCLPKLNPELQRFVHKSFNGNKWICHHLINQPLPLDADGIDICNNLLVSKQKSFDDALKNEDWLKWILIIEEPMRAMLLNVYKKRIKSHIEYWQLVSSIWMNLHFIHDKMDDLIQLFEDPRPGREFLMNESERATLSSMPDVIEIWRGHRNAVTGWSWTINKDIAIWFAMHSCGKNLSHGYCKKNDVVAYYNQRKEHEIVIYPSKIFDISCIDVSNEVESFLGSSFGEAFPI